MEAPQVETALPELAIAGAEAEDWSSISAVAEDAIAKLDEFGPTVAIPPALVSKEELPKILDSHRLWLSSDGAEGKRADLTGAKLQDADLTGADLRRAILSKTDFAGAELFMAQLQEASLEQADLSRTNLLGAEFSRADLRGARLDEAKGVQLNQFSGSNLREASLPESLSEAAAIADARRITRSAAGMLAGLLLFCVLSCLRAVTARDAQLIRDSATLPVPLLKNFLPMTAFFLITPVLLLSVFIALHRRLFRVWEAVETLPAVLPSGKQLAECGPWLVIALGFREFEWLRGRRTALNWIEATIASLSAYWVTPLALLVFWARELTFQDSHLAMLNVFLLAAAIEMAAVLPVLNTRKPFSEGALTLSAKSLAKHSPLRMAAGPIVGLALTLLSFGTIWGAPHAGNKGAQSNAKSIASWPADILWSAHLDPYPNLAERDVSTKPVNWSTADEMVAGTSGARLHDRNLRHALAYRAYFAKAELWQSNLDGSDFSLADLRLADLHRSSLEGALLNQAELEQTNLEAVDLRGAMLVKADLNQSNLSFALLAGARLDDAKLEHASLYQANLQSAQLANTNFAGADLRGASLNLSKLDDANLEGAYLSSTHFLSAELRRTSLKNSFLTQADLRQADLRRSDLRGAIVTDADLHGANLEGANLLGVSGLTAAQVCSAHFNVETQFDDTLAMQVNQICPQK